MEERLGRKQNDETKRNELAEHFGDDLLFADNFDNAIIGVSMGISCGTKVVYDAEEMAKTLDGNMRSIPGVQKTETLIAVEA